MHVITLKIPIMGEAGVGKTSLANVLSGNHFPEEYRSTIGVDIFVRTFQRGNAIYRIQFWDLAGQRRFSFLRRIFYRGAHGAIFMFDITRRETFKDLEGWIEDFLSVYPRTPIIVVGNKVDMANKRQVLAREGASLADRFGTIYIETSVKLGLNVIKVFEKLLDMIPKKLGVLSI